MSNYIQVNPENFADEYADKDAIIKLHSQFRDCILNKLPSESYVAGGIIRSFVEEDNRNFDLDLYFDTKEGQDLCANYFWSKDFKSYLSYSNYKYAHNEKIWVDLIYKEGTPLETISQFDFTCCSLAFSKDMIHYHKDAFKDIKNKTLSIIDDEGNEFPRYHRTREENDNIYERFIFRYKKYLDKGYSLSLSTLDRLIEIFSDVNVSERIYSMEPDIKESKYKGIKDLFFKYIDTAI